MDPAPKLEGKIAIVTGGASGIGEATVGIFVEHGARMVVIADIQDERGRAVADSVGTERCSFVHCDVTDEEQVKGMVEWTVQNYGQVDIMFSNVGTGSKSPQTILDLDLAAFDRVMQVNVHGMAACMKHAARAMVESKVRGSIVCTSSVVTTTKGGGMQRTDYIASKHAVLGLVKCASRQLGEHGIRVNSVSPSAIPTALACEINGKSKEDMAKIFDNAFGPLTSLKGGVLSARHVAEAVLFLVSNDSAFVTGQDLVVDGLLVDLPLPATYKL